MNGEFLAVCHAMHPYETRIDEIKTALTASYPDWDPARDQRFTVFAKLKNVANVAAFSLIVMEKHLSHPKWWEEVMRRPISARDHSIYLTEFHQAAKLTFLITSFSNAESALRAYVRAIDPAACNGGASEFKSIYEHLYRSHLSIGLDAIALLDLLRLLRNTLHNAGVYVSKNGHSTFVNYGGRRYDFTHGLPINFADWNTLFLLHIELANLLHRTVSDPVIVALALVDDPAHGSLPIAPAA